MVILSQAKFPEILYIDGFAGPGKYAGGEDGSPIIALKTALGYKLPLAAKVHFHFVEKDQARSDHLREIIGAAPFKRRLQGRVHDLRKGMEDALPSLLAGQPAHSDVCLHRPLRLEGYSLCYRPVGHAAPQL